MLRRAMIASTSVEYWVPHSQRRTSAFPKVPPKAVREYSTFGRSQRSASERAERRGSRTRSSRPGTPPWKSQEVSGPQNGFDRSKPAARRRWPRSRAGRRSRGPREAGAQTRLADVQPAFRRIGFDWRAGLEKPRNREVDMENVSRRKMLSLLGLGATLGFALSGVLEPSVAQAQEAAPAVPNPTAPATGSAEATGTHGMQRRKGRRSHRSERRHSRHERRHTRRTGKPAEAPAATAPAQ